jgi:hypothetical protein
MASSSAVVSRPPTVSSHLRLVLGYGLMIAGMVACYLAKDRMARGYRLLRRPRLSRGRRRQDFRARSVTYSRMPAMISPITGG